MGLPCVVSMFTETLSIGYDGRAGMATVILSPNITAADISALLGRLMRHCKAMLHRGAIPVFLRISRNSYALHNNKQNKIPLKRDAFDLDAIYGAGNNVEEGLKQGKDLVLWWPGGLKTTGGVDTWIILEREDWASIVVRDHCPAAKL